MTIALGTCNTRLHLANYNVAEKIKKGGALKDMIYAHEVDVKGNKKSGA